MTSANLMRFLSPIIAPHVLDTIAIPRILLISATSVPSFFDPSAPPLKPAQYATHTVAGILK